MDKLPDSIYDHRFQMSLAISIGECECCNSKIYEGDTHYNFHGYLICEDCLINYCYENYRII